MSQDDSLVRSFLIQAMKSRPFFWDKSREDFNNFKSADTSKKEWLDILEEVGVMPVMFLHMHLVMIDELVMVMCVCFPILRFERHSRPTLQLWVGARSTTLELSSCCGNGSSTITILFGKSKEIRRRGTTRNTLVRMMMVRPYFTCIFQALHPLYLQTPCKNNGPFGRPWRLSETPLVMMVPGKSSSVTCAPISSHPICPCGAASNVSRVT